MTLVSPLAPGELADVFETVETAAATLLRLTRAHLPGYVEATELHVAVARQLENGAGLRFLSNVAGDLETFAQALELEEYLDAGAKAFGISRLRSSAFLALHHALLVAAARSDAKKGGAS